MTYQPPVQDVSFALKTAGGLEAGLRRGLYDDVDTDTVEAVLTEAGRFASEVLAPLNRVGDQAGVKLSGGKVETPPGWHDAYQQFTDAGWSALPCPEEFGGQGLPKIVSTAVMEFWNAANLSFGMCPLLTQGAIDAIEIGGSDELKARYLPRLVSGEWSGTMNLTEPQAGSDLSILSAKAVPEDDGTFRIFGTKIYISYGEHGLAENIIHLVLARLPDAPEGTRGISLFLVPKFLVNEDGSLGARNDVVCAGVEEKLGIHASPTCVMTYGESGGAIGYLVGEANKGLQTMFIMMNAARLAVGMQGVALADRSMQHAVRYAQERRQGRSADGSDGPTPIINHADVRRMLMSMQSMTQAARLICFATAAATDAAERAKDPADREAAHARTALLTPIAKAFSTDVAVEVASLGVQIHGGMGFIEDTGAAQYYRDARILPIYEGTNGIQAIDLVARKLPLGEGAAMRHFLEDLGAIAEAVALSNRPEFGVMGARLSDALAVLRESSLWLGEHRRSDPETALAGATPYLRLFGLTAGGCFLAQGALEEVRGGSAGRYTALARYFAENELQLVRGLAAQVMAGAPSLFALSPEELSQ